MDVTRDFVVAGGSVAGLTFAAEAARRGADVLVLEEHPEIGEPEKCDGLVSLRGLRKYGYEPRREVVQDAIGAGVIHSPGGRTLALNATALEVVVMDRSGFDRQVADVAKSAGSELRTGVRVASMVEGQDGVEVVAGDSRLRAKYFVDATGPSSSPREGIIPAAKYEIEGDWVTEHVVEVFADTVRFPGFFAWVIPYGRGRAKVGAAGRGVNPFRALDDFLEERPSRILRRVSAPIYIGGPSPTFVRGRRIFVGESAGQVKPTTAGGITTSVAGAVAAAKWACEAVQNNDPRLLRGYQAEWEGEFMKEMKTMLRLRGVFEKLSNADLDALVTALSARRVASKLSQGDFDFHASSLLGALGIQGVLRMARVVASAEARSLLAGA